MKEILVTGHRNPDMDSVCSAWAWAKYKNIVDKENKYIAVRCGNLNNQTKTAFRLSSEVPPVFIKDVRTRVSDITRRENFRLDINEPVYKAIKILDEENISCIPVFENGENFQGIVTIHQINSFLISENTGMRPLYRFRVDNFESVLPGSIFKRGVDEEFNAPIMTGAMPLSVSLKRIEKLKPLKPLLVVGLRKKIIKYAVKHEFPAIIISGTSTLDYPELDLSEFKGTIFLSKTDTAETIRLLRLSAPVKDIMNTKPEIIPADMNFDEAKTKLVNSRYRGLPVFEKENFDGIVTRRCFIEKPLRKIILVDHNESAQSVPGADEAEIIEIIDHHRVAPRPTITPIFMDVRPVGSTCTIVFSHFISAGIEIEKGTAMLLLCGIISDTVILKSPTTTDVDRLAAKKLSKICGWNIDDLGNELLKNSAIIEKPRIKEIVNADFKEYQVNKLNLGVGQAEVINFNGVDELLDDIVFELKNICKEKNLDCAMLMITNVIKENSLLVTSGCDIIEKKLIYKNKQTYLFELQGVLSRKKQLLPELIRAAESIENI